MPLSSSLLLSAVYAGIQGLLAAGAHTDVAGRQSGIAAGAILQAGAWTKRLGIRIEGVPPVSLPQKPSAFYGAATPQLSLLSGAVRFAVDPAAQVWVGIGETIINQRTPLPNLSQVVASRLAGVRYETQYRHAYSPTHFIEVQFGTAPHLTGVDRYTYSIPNTPEVDKAEVASEEDATVAIGYTHGETELLFGLRTIDFSARYIATGEAGDRNNGAGLIVEWRRFILK
ncbi:MAG TPA: hypothetical protein VFE17_09265 [Candidatus Baltobacteraceae bacterium]|jgi:hypothetical protein|nr:hypothetical protein [Candidatus Baltobacteraceae bacterium]